MERSDFLARLSSRVLGEQPRQDTLAQRVLPGGRVPAAHERVDLFIDRLHELGVTASVVASRGDARDALERLVSERAWSSVACAPGLRWPGIFEKWTVEAGAAPLGLCEADWAVAETGTVVLRSSAGVRRGYSLLPAAAAFFVSERCIVTTVGDVLRELAAGERALPSCVSFVSGPSSTADIAAVRIVGVHGPREVFVWVIAEAADGAVDHGGTGHEAQGT